MSYVLDLPISLPNLGIDLPAPHFWFTGSVFYTMGSFALFAALGFAGIASMTAGYRKLMVSGYVVAIILFALGTWQSAQQEKAAAETRSLLDNLAHLNPPAQPDLTLRFLDPKEPTIQVVNPSDGIARTVRYSPALFNIDAADHNQSLLVIPTGGPDFIRPHSVAGPTVLFAPLAKANLKSGDRIFGTIGLLCPECKQGRTFVVYIVWGEGGWFSELNDVRNGEILTPKGQNYWNIDDVTKFVNSVPAQSKIEIKDRDHIDANNP